MGIGLKRKDIQALEEDLGKRRELFWPGWEPTSHPISKEDEQAEYEKVLKKSKRDKRMTYPSLFGTKDDREGQ